MQSFAGPRRRSLLKPLLIAALCLLTHSSNAAPTEGTKMVAAREAVPNATPDMDALTDDLSRRQYTNGDQNCGANAATGETVTCQNGQPVNNQSTGQQNTTGLFSIQTSIDTSGGWNAIQEEISTNKTAAYLLCVDLLGKSFRQRYAGRYFRNGGKAKRENGNGRSDVQALCDSAAIRCDADGNLLPSEGSVQDICNKRTGGGPPEVAAIGSTGNSEVEAGNSTDNTTEPAGGWTSDEQRIQADYARGQKDEERRRKEEEDRRKREEAARAAQDAERARQQQGYRKERRAASPAAEANPKPQNNNGITYNADGSWITPDQAVHRPDGTYTTPDGAVHRPDGSYTTNDGVVHRPDGSYTTPDGAVHKPDGSYTLADGTAYNADGSLASSGNSGNSGTSGTEQQQQQQQQQNTTTGIETANATNTGNLFTVDTSQGTDGANNTDSTETGGGIEMATNRGGPQPKRQTVAAAYFRRPTKRSAGAEEAFDIEGAGVAGEDLGKRFDAREARAEEEAVVVEKRTEKKKVRGGHLRRMVAAESGGA